MFCYIKYVSYDNPKVTRIYVIRPRKRWNNSGRSHKIVNCLESVALNVHLTTVSGYRKKFCLYL